MLPFCILISPCMWCTFITTCRYTHNTCNNKPGQATHRIIRYYLPQLELSSPRHILATPHPHIHTHSLAPTLVSPLAHPGPPHRRAGPQAGGEGCGARPRPPQRPRPRPLCAVRLKQLRARRRYCHHFRPPHPPLAAAAGSAPPSVIPYRTRRCHHPARGPGSRP
jgi:hypothetical protein